MASITIQVGPLTASATFPNDQKVATVLREFAGLPAEAAGQAALDAALQSIINAVEEGAARNNALSARALAREAMRLR